MKIMERLTQQIFTDKWDDLEALDKKYNQIESGVGFPPKKRYRLILSSKSINTLVVEREWESFADFEKAYEKLMTMPEWHALNAESDSIIEDGHTEILMPVP